MCMHNADNFLVSQQLINTLTELCAPFSENKGASCCRHIEEADAVKQGGSVA